MPYRSKFSFIFQVISALLWLCSTAAILHADDVIVPPKLVEYARQVKFPGLLFHWSTPQGMRELAEIAQNKDQLTFRKLDGGPLASRLVQRAPELADRPALFTWSNPITGMMGMDPDELYARKDPTTGEPARLLVVRTEADSKTAVLFSMLSDPSAGPVPQLEGADFIFHIVYGGTSDDPRIKFQEWVILNPAKLKSFTGNPDQIRTLLEAELARADDPAFRYAVEDCHSRPALSNNPHIRADYYVPTLKALLEPSYLTGLPSFFYRDLN